MKISRLWKVALVTGTDAELDKLEQVAKGTHHVHRNQKGGPRKAKVEIYGESPATSHAKHIARMDRQIKEQMEADHGSQH